MAKTLALIFSQLDTVLVVVVSVLLVFVVVLVSDWNTDRASSLDSLMRHNGDAPTKGENDGYCEGTR